MMQGRCWFWGGYELSVEFVVVQSMGVQPFVLPRLHLMKINRLGPLYKIRNIDNVCNSQNFICVYIIKTYKKRVTKPENGWDF